MWRRGRASGEAARGHVSERKRLRGGHEAALREVAPLLRLLNLIEPHTLRRPVAPPVRVRARIRARVRARARRQDQGQGAEAGPGPGRGAYPPSATWSNTSSTLT